VVLGYSFGEHSPGGVAARLQLAEFQFSFQSDLWRRRVASSLALPHISSVPVPQLALHIKIYTASRGFVATARLLSIIHEADFICKRTLNTVRIFWYNIPAPIEPGML